MGRSERQNDLLCGVTVLSRNTNTRRNEGLICYFTVPHESNFVENITRTEQRVAERLFGTSAY